MKIYKVKKLEDKIKGLMNIKNINFGLLITNCISIHTFNMLDNIDIIFLDLNNQILSTYINVAPNSIIKTNYDQNKTNVLELPQNTSLYFNISDKIIL